MILNRLIDRSIQLLLASPWPFAAGADSKRLWVTHKLACDTIFHFASSLSLLLSLPLPPLSKVICFVPPP